MEDGFYFDDPDATPRFETVSLGQSGEKASILPSALTRDVTGDERPDLLVQKGRKGMRVFSKFRGQTFSPRGLTRWQWRILNGIWSRITRCSSAGDGKFAGMGGPDRRQWARPRSGSCASRGGRAKRILLLCGPPERLEVLARDRPKGV